MISDFTRHFEDRGKYIAIFGYTNDFYFCMSLSGLIWIPTRALVLLGWFFTRRALRSSSTPRRGSQVRTGPSAGRSPIRTIGPAEDPRRRRDIGSRRAAFSVAASRADTSPSLETLVPQSPRADTSRMSGFVRFSEPIAAAGCGAVLRLV